MKTVALKRGLGVMWLGLLLGLPACDEPVDTTSPLVLAEADEDGDGYTNTASGGADCDDGASEVHPGAIERGDGQDNDCDAAVDEDTPASDDDGDSFSEEQGDSDDADPHTYPGAPEIGDQKDNDQDGQVDEGTLVGDDDGDGVSEADGDPDDTDPNTYPDAPEVADGRDNDADGTIDEGTDLYDDDGDGFTEADGDPDDSDPTRVPEAPTPVLAATPTPEPDADGDGFSPADGDCNDRRANVYPGADELVGGKPDGIDNDCDGLVDEGTSVADGDGDGFTPANGDCDDTDASVHPGASEASDGADQDCDDLVDEGTNTHDDDGDGLSEAEGDCDDTDAAVAPGAPETCDGRDEGCDGFVDEPCQPCGVPSDIATAEEAIRRGCAEVRLQFGAPTSLRVVDPPGSVWIHPTSAAVVLDGLELILTEGDHGERRVELTDLVVAGPVSVQNADEASSVELRGLVVSGVESAGAAVSVSGYGVLIEDASITDNTSTGHADVAGGLSVVDAPRFTLRRVALRRNEATSAVDDAAGGLYLSGAKTTGTVENCLFEANLAHAPNGAGAIFVEPEVQGQLTLRNLTFVYNENSQAADAASMRCQGALPGGSLDSVIMWYQAGKHILGCSQAPISYSTFQARVPSGAGNDSVDPRFADLASYELGPTSPVIDKGNPAADRRDLDGTVNDQGWTGGPGGL